MHPKKLAGTQNSVAVRTKKHLARSISRVGRRPLVISAVLKARPPGRSGAAADDDGADY